MCLAIPMKVVARSGEMGEVEQDGVRREVSFALVPQAQLGDYVLVHAGFAIECMDEHEAAETLALLERLVADQPAMASPAQDAEPERGKDR